LGATAADDAVTFILKHAEKRVRAAVKKLNAKTLPELLMATAQEVSTRFEIVGSDADLTRLVETSVARGESGFAQLPKDFRDSFGVTLRLLKRRDWEPEHVSVIDCRGSKRHRSYYTKWHELAHLLTLTRQGQLKFRRTHAERQPADEALMELVAGNFGYWSEILQAHLKGDLSFEALTRIRSEQCPEGSWQSFVHAAIDRWSVPAVYVKAEIRLKRGEERLRNQQGLWPMPTGGKLRLADVVVNDSARSRGAALYPNMRVPEQSILHRIYAGEATASTADECLSMWESTDRGALQRCAVVVQGRPAYEAVEGLITFE
jgi:hypothetical protein